MTRNLLLIGFLGVSTCHAEIPALLREEKFTCATLAEAANHFISLGEDAAIRELNSLSRDVLDYHVRDGDEVFNVNERIAWICRIVFDPKEKQPLRDASLGALIMPYLTMPLESWPRFPIAESGSSYFVLSEGRFVSGLPESPKAYIAYCQRKGRFRVKLLKIPTREQALHDFESLRESPQWQAIKWEDSDGGLNYSLSEEPRLLFIKKQAEAIPPQN